MIRRLVAAALAAAVVVAVVPALPAAAAAPRIGADVSKYQCGAPWAGAQAFAVVAVNDGLPTGTNPCLAEQLALAVASPGGGRPSVYVNTANPAPHEASWWPTRDRTKRGVAVRSPYGRCRGGATAACSWVYGASLALDDLQIRGVPRNTAARWWLDVETANTWRGSRKQHRAVLEGMTWSLVRAGQRVGLYALDHEFRDLIGPVPTSSALTRLPTWLAGAADAAAAAARRCSAAPLTRGRVLLTQWTTTAGTDRFDLDLACSVLSPAPRPTATGRHLVGARLTAKAGTWAAGTRLHYRWTRDGRPIAGATSPTHRVVRADAGHRVAVVVTGTRDGSSRAVRTSRSVAIRR
ncbi:hypothetical protein [Amnibacterium endophyticum]|uniref:Ig-like domain-containing protein n=1 Tax=Amnibacterium endophyticum TaxID=2109337 RepID=A0ABW4LID5_9MICO